MINNILESKFRRCLLFFILALIPMVPFLVFQRFHMDWDSWFHFSRIYELSENIKYGKIIPDVSYYSFNHQGYAVNFFYPYFVNYPIAILLIVINKPVLTVIIFNVLFHFLGLNISFNSYFKLKQNPKTALLFSIIYIFGYSTFNVRMLNMGTYNQQIAYIFLPLAIIGIYQLIFEDFKSWQFEVILSIILITLTHLLTTYLLVIYTLVLFLCLLLLDRKKITLARINSWLLSGISIIGGTLIFIVPLIEQKKSNDWLKVPAMNLGTEGIIANSVSKVTWLERINSALTFQDIVILILFFSLLLAATYKLFNKETNILIGAILIVSIIQSNLIPYFYLQKIAFIDMIQTLNRFDTFFYFFIALLIVIIVENYNQIFEINNKTIFYGAMILYLLFNCQSFDKQNDIFTGEISEFDKVSYFATNENIYKGLANSNFGYFSADAGKGFYRINGFMDYRTNQQIKRIPREDGKYDIDSGSYKIENGNSFAPIINFPKSYQVSTNDLIENAVYFDGQREFKKFNQDKFTFTIKDVPKGTKVVRSPITYLKGFVAKNSDGKILYSYKDKDGWLAIEKPETKKIFITYHKTIAHKLAIGISLITWILLPIIAVFKSKSDKRKLILS